MNVLDAEAGSCAKPRAACCAATKALVTLIVISRLKAANGRANGSSGGVSVDALTVNFQ
jgi:hypothetical protein